MTRLDFTEYEAFAETVREASVAMRISSLTESKWMLRYTHAGALRLQQGYEGGGTLAEGATIGEGWVVFHQTGRVLANGQVATEREVFVAPPGGEFCLASHDPHEWLTVFVPTPLLLAASSELEQASFGSARVLKPPPQAIRRFANLVRRFLAAAEARPLLLDAPHAVDSFRQELLAVIRELFTRLQPAANRHFVRWQGYAKATVEFATSQPEQSWSIAELAQQNGVPERTLRTAFQRCYGLSPVEYLRIYRLHQARGLLRVGRPDETTVTQIAYALGFWELGRFARDYRRLFQELPSETLKRSGRQKHGG